MFLRGAGAYRWFLCRRYDLPFRDETVVKSPPARASLCISGIRASIVGPLLALFRFGSRSPWRRKAIASTPFLAVGAARLNLQCAGNSGDAASSDYRSVFNVTKTLDDSM